MPFKAFNNKIREESKEEAKQEHSSYIYSHTHTQLST